MSEPPQLSIYTYLFGARRAELDLDRAVTNFLAFADEVVIATVANQEDDTLERLRVHEANAVPRGHLKIVVVDMDINKNNRFDGDLKTAALKACTSPIRIIADCDERFVLSQRPLWQAAAVSLLRQPYIDGWTIPVIDLFGDYDHIRADQHIGVKFRMHKDTVVRRGVPAFAERGEGFFDTSLSDSTEPILANGDLANFRPYVPQHYLHPGTHSMLNGYPFVLHEGFLDLGRRAKLGRDFWKTHWESRSGRTENVVTDANDYIGIPVIKHSFKTI